MTSHSDEDRNAETEKWIIQTQVWMSEINDNTNLDKCGGDWWWKQATRFEQYVNDEKHKHYLTKTPVLEEKLKQLENLEQKCKIKLFNMLNRMESISYLQNEIKSLLGDYEEISSYCDDIDFSKIYRIQIIVSLSEQISFWKREAETCLNTTSQYNILRQHAEIREKAELLTQKKVSLDEFAIKDKHYSTNLNYARLAWEVMSRLSCHGFTVDKDSIEADCDKLNEVSKKMRKYKKTVFDQWSKDLTNLKQYETIANNFKDDAFISLKALKVIKDFVLAKFKNSEDFFKKEIAKQKESKTFRFVRYHPQHTYVKQTPNEDNERINVEQNDNPIVIPNSKTEENQSSCLDDLQIKWHGASGVEEALARQNLTELEEALKKKDKDIEGMKSFNKEQEFYAGLYENTNEQEEKDFEVMRSLNEKQKLEIESLTAKLNENNEQKEKDLEVMRSIIKNQKLEIEALTAKFNKIEEGNKEKAEEQLDEGSSIKVLSEPPHVSTSEVEQKPYSMTKEKAEALIMKIDERFINQIAMSKENFSDYDMRYKDHKTIPKDIRCMIRVMDAVEVMFLRNIEQKRYKCWKKYIMDLERFGSDVLTKSDSLSMDTFKSIFPCWKGYRENRPYTKEDGVLLLDETLVQASKRVARSPWIPPPGDDFETFVKL